jgi:hypothetical protein
MKAILNYGLTSLAVLAISAPAFAAGSAAKGTKLASATTTVAPAAPAAAAEAAAPAASVATSADVAAPRLLDKIVLRFDAIFHGPGLSSDDNQVNPGNYGIGDGDRVFFENVATAGYRLSPNYTLTANVPFDWKYSGSFKETVLNDAYLRLKANKILARGEFTLDADLRAYVPTNEANRAKKEVGSLRSTQYFTWQPAGSRFSAGTYSYIRGYAWGTDVAGNRSLRAYLGPHVNYQILPNLSAELLYEMVGFTKTGGSAFDWYNEGTDLEPSLAWDVTPNITIIPYLDIKTGGRVAADTTSMNIWFVANIL